MIKLFLTFFKIGLLTFGGGYGSIPLIMDELEYFGISESELSGYIAISESTPGPFAVNIATFIGYDMYGILGGVLATIGVILPTFIVMLIISMIIHRIRQSNFFKNFMIILIPLILGLILSTLIEITGTNLFNVYKLNFSTFSPNYISIISFSILLPITLIYFFLKRKKISPFILIGISLLIGSVSYLLFLLNA